MSGSGTAKDAERVVRFLRTGIATVSSAARAGEVLLEGKGRGTIAVPVATVRDLVERGIIGWRSDHLCLLALPQGLGKPPAPDGNGGHVEAKRIVDPEGARIEVLVNTAESPLANLMRRKTREGAAFLSDREFAAGERLRSDYSRGALLPRTGMNWASPVASGKRGTGAGAADLTEAALAARIRVDRALHAVGPELSGVLVDICCFLKGLEQVEGERGWPVRSAKIVLKTGLGVLARHYDPRAGDRRKETMLHWGSADYRPDTA